MGYFTIVCDSIDFGKFMLARSCNERRKEGLGRWKNPESTKNNSPFRMFLWAREKPVRVRESFGQIKPLTTVFEKLKVFFLWCAVSRKLVRFFLWLFKQTANVNKKAVF